MAVGAVSRRRLAVVAAVLGVLLVIVILGWLYVRGGGPVPASFGLLRPAQADRLAASEPAEQVLRTLRLVGVDRAVAGARGRAAIVRIELPAADSSADVTVAWEAGLGALRAAYPKADSYTVQIFGPGATPLVELSWKGADARSTDDGAQLRSRATVKLIAEEGAR